MSLRLQKSIRETDAFYDDRPTPFTDIGAERCVLGAALASKSGVNLSVDWFDEPRHKLIASALLDCRRQPDDTSMAHPCAALVVKRGQWAAAGETYVHYLLDEYGHRGATYESDRRVLAEKQFRRTVRAWVRDIVDVVGTASPDEMFERVRDLKRTVDAWVANG